MSTASCEVCSRRLLRDFVYCPVCGTPVPGGAASFAFESANDEATQQLFTKPAPETSLGWRPIAGALVALVAIVAIFIAISGTGADVAQAPTPTPEPTATSGVATPTPGPGISGFTMPPNTNQLNTDQPNTDQLNTELLNDLPPDLPRVEAGSNARDYADVLLELAGSYELEGTVVFHGADRAARVNLGTGEVTMIPLEGREYKLGGKAGIVTEDPGRGLVAQRWDGPERTLEIDGGIDGFFDTWMDPNGWELAPFSNNVGVGLIAPWSLAPDGTTPTAVPASMNLVFNGPIQLDTTGPEMWTWDDGSVPLPWKRVLAWNQSHLLVEACDDPPDCRLVVVDGDDHTIAEVADSLGSELENQFFVLSSKASIVRFEADVRFNDPETVAFTGQTIAGVDIVNLQTESTQRLPQIDLSMLAGTPFWIDDGLVVYPIAIESAGDQIEAARMDTRADVIFNRAGTPVAVLEWEDPLMNNTESQLRYFLPDGEPRSTS